MRKKLHIQSPKPENQASSSPEADFFLPTFSHRVRRATVIGIISALAYLLFFSNSYAAVVGDLLLNLIMGRAYYQLDSQHIYALAHSINAICWFLVGAIPFLITERVMLSILLWLGIGIGVVICGFLIIVIAVSPMWP